MKNFIKLLFFFISYLIRHNKDSKVVYYHDVGTKYTDMGTDIQLMKQHFTIIRKSGYDIVPSVEKRKKQVMICFDDGWAGIYDHKDFFIQQNIKPTIFIAVDLIDKDGYLTKEQIKELQQTGFRFEGHTWSHKSLTGFNDEELEHELRESKEVLEKLLGSPITAICYPQGRFSMHVHDLCKQYGYERQFSSLHGGYYDLAEKGIICRMCAQFSTSTEFKWMLNGTSRLFRKRLIKQHVKGSL